MNRVLVIYDQAKQLPDGTEYGWAYWRRAKALEKFAPSDFKVTAVKLNSYPDNIVRDYDLVFNLEYSHAQAMRKTIDQHSPGTPYVVSYNSDSRRRGEWWDKCRAATERNAILLCNNQEVFDFHGRLKGTANISNGVDCSVFRSTTPIEERPHRALWCGSSSAKKGKGFHDVFQLMYGGCKELGITLELRPIDDINPKVVKPTTEQVKWYNSGSYILCGAKTEGTPNTSLEGMACGCVLVSTRVGNVIEFGIDKENVVFTERGPGPFLAALRYAMGNRKRISEAGVKTMREGWDYPIRAPYFFQLFRQCIRDGCESIKPFTYSEIEPAGI